MSSNPIQYVTLVSGGGTPVRIADQKGSPYPTTGYGALVFNINPTIEGGLIVNGDIVFTGDLQGPYNSPLTTQGDLYYYGPTGNTRLPVGAAGTTLTSDGNNAFWRTGGASPGGSAGGDLDGTYPNPTIKLDVGLQGDPTRIAVVPVGANNQTLATTKFVKDQGYLTTATAGTTYLPLTGGTLTGPLIGTAATFSGGELVGYGTAVPFQAYAGSTQTPLAQIATAGQASLSIQRYVGGGVATGPLLNFSKSQGSTAGTQAIAINTDMMGTLSFNASDGVKFVEGAYIRAEVDGAPGLNDMPGRLIFATSPDGSAAPAEAMRISNTKAVTLAGALTGTTATFSGAEKVMSATAIPAGGTAGAGYLFSSTTNFGMIFGSGAPTAAMARGSIYLRSDGGGPYVNTDGATTWTVMGGGGGASLTISDTPPGSPTAGAMWWNSVLGTLMVYYNDGNSSQWVPATPTMAGSYLPLAGGTLTGPLTGTTATFSGAVTVGNPLLQVSNDPNWTMRTAASTVAWRMGSNITGTTDGYWYLQHSTNNFSSSSIPLLIDQTGAATFAGPLTGTTATFNGGGVNGALKVTTNDSIIGGLFAGATKGVRIVPNAAFTAIEGVDNTGVGSYQPLTISGSVVNIAAPLSGTTATFSGTVMAPGAQIQMVSVETGAVATGTTVTPLDDTIPQITEGNEFMTLAITPKSATSTLVIDVIWVGASSATGTLVCALHQDAIANALAASVLVQTGADNMLTMTLCHKMTSGTTSATTFRVRVGLNGAGTITFNGRSAARQLGGVMASSIVIREVAP